MKRFLVLLCVTAVFQICVGTALAAVPSVSSWDTGGTTTNVNEWQNIIITFNSNPTLNAATLTNSNVYVRTGSSCTVGTNWPVAITYSLGNPVSTVTLTPTTAYTSSGSFIACARRNTTNGIKNTSGDSLNATSSRTFSVRDWLNPTVSTYLPNPPSGVQSNTNPSFVITFSELMNTATITTSSVLLENLTDSTSVSLNSPTFTTSSGKTVATFTLPSALLSLKTYQVTVKNTVTDQSGNPMDVDFSWTFSVDNTAPQVVSYTPYSAVSPVYVNTSSPVVSAVFSEVIQNPTTVNFYLKQGATTVPTTPSFDGGTYTASLALSGGLSNNLTYTATLLGNSASGIKDTIGNQLPASVSWSFIVDTQVPVVSAVSPVSGATSVAVNSPIVVDFTENQGINESTINSSTVRVSDGTQDIAVVLSYVAATKRLTITPAGNMLYNTTYTVSLGGGLADKAGNLLSSVSWSFATQPVTANAYSQVPPFLTAPVTPNILIILDNSNSMDEDMNVNAIGSPYCTDYSDPNSCSKSVIARRALTGIINTYADKMKIGLMSYKINAPTAYRLHNSFYFNSYEAKSYCPSPPTSCYNYCVNESVADRNDCNSTCQAQNSLFDATYRDEILTTGTTSGSARRQTYCSLIYPKYQKYTDENGVTVYYGLPGTFYAGSNQGTRYLYSEGYNPSTAADSYKYYSTKIGTSDLNSGYSSQTGSGTFSPTDSDLALGFDDFGRRNYWYYTSRTWFRNDSPGPGYLHVQAALNSDPPTNTQKNALLTKLGGNRTPAYFENDEAGYMTWTSESASQIINAGLTPTAGTLQSAINYFNGTLVQGSTIPSPIQHSCQRNYVIYVTDGLPSVNESGTAGSASALMPAALTKLDNLRCPTSATGDNCKVTSTIAGTTTKHDVRTFIIGMGLNSAARASLDAMAVKGGTDVGGHAYYANNLTDLNNALINIFQNILSQLSSGTAASILNNSEGSGANLLQAVFYPKKTFDSGSECSWTGEMQGLWYYLDPMMKHSSVRIDKVADNKLNLLDDYIADFYYDDSVGRTMVRLSQDLSGDGKTTAVDPLGPYDPDNATSVKSLWRAGRLLWARNLSTDDRKIYTKTGNASFDSVVNSASESTGLALFNSALKDDATVRSYLQAADATEANKIISYIRGTDQTGYRSRSATIDGTAGTWRLGDIISSTPKIQGNVALNSYHLEPPTGYGDASYNKYIKSNNYANRGIAYVGANDGMLHAFRMGVLHPLTDPCRKLESDSTAAKCYADKAELNNYSTVASGVDKGANADIRANSSDVLGREEWAFIPRQQLPYLKYLTDTDYPHLFYVNGPTTVLDVAINSPTGCASNYWDCPKKTTYEGEDTPLVTTDDTRNLVLGNTSWRTILIGSTGLGGASRNSGGVGACFGGGTECVKTPVDSLGYSSYFALDVTDPKEPKYMWDFYGDPTAGTTTAEKGGNLGYATTGPALVRVGAKDKNGRWFAVFASGPTGPIDSTYHQLLGRSDQTLKIFIVDVATGALVKTIDTGIANAFAGSVSNAGIDNDRSFPYKSGFYQDDAVYIGYVRKDGSVWNQGGVIRLITNESVDPNDGSHPWSWSYVMQDIGPITGAVTKLQDRAKGNLWLFFGTGRYYYKSSTDLDDAATTRRLFGIQEPCYVGANVKINPACTTTRTVAELKDMTSTPTASLGAGDKGWYIDLDASSASFAAERVVANPTAVSNGVVYFITYSPSMDVCSFTGNSYIWAVKYSTGGVASAASMSGSVTTQQSTGAHAVVTGADFTNAGGRKTGALKGLSSPDFLVVTNPKPVKKIIHVQEK